MELVELERQIAELEKEQEQNDFGSLPYDVVDAELQDLYGMLNKLKED